MAPLRSIRRAELKADRGLAAQTLATCAANAAQGIQLVFPCRVKSGPCDLFLGLEPEHRGTWRVGDGREIVADRAAAEPAPVTHK